MELITFFTLKTFGKKDLVLVFKDFIFNYINYI